MSKFNPSKMNPKNLKKVSFCEKNDIFEYPLDKYEKEYKKNKSRAITHRELISGSYYKIVQNENDNDYQTGEFEHIEQYPDNDLLRFKNVRYYKNDEHIANLRYWRHYTSDDIEYYLLKIE